MIATHVQRMDRLAPEANKKVAEGQAIYKEVSETLCHKFPFFGILFLVIFYNPPTQRTNNLQAIC